MLHTHLGPARSRSSSGTHHICCVKACSRRLKPLSSPRRQQASATATAAAGAPTADAVAALQSACAVRRAHIGLNAQGFRGLIASNDLSPGDVVVSVPLHNILQVPRQLTGAAAGAAAAAAATALDRWQQQHGTLPAPLLDLVLDPGCPWEAKLVAWLLQLKAAAAPGSLWHSYCQVLPAAEETLSFFCYSEQQAEQLQFGTWKALAHKHRELLQQVQQECAVLYTSSSGQQAVTTADRGCSSSSSGSSTTLTVTDQDVAWALSLVKSRTFGRQLQQQQQQQQVPARGSQQPVSKEAAAAAAGEGAPAAAAAAAAELEPGRDGDDSEVVLLMVPYVDMINHSPCNNCSFDVDWSKGCFEITCTVPITNGSEVTISYGSNKSNLALLSCYGFFQPGNFGDAQLLRPMFEGCLAAAGRIKGFDQELVAAAAAAAAAADLANQRQRQDELQLARQQCAVTALPVTTLQQYAAQLLLYQVRQILRLCGTTAGEDAAASKQAAMSAQDGLPMAAITAAVDGSIIAARLEQKLLLQECEAVGQNLLSCIQQRLKEV
ncbi:hypothetical protein COO60DRAFT_447276 [Scenedesmus sp. NREL 46B-D3]|nr:hypothetical protein COO60DRAFT_447276 [Scenedesmus sp. NREL 46B-D3]